MISGTPKHDAIQMIEMRYRIFQSAYTAIDTNEWRIKALFETIDTIIIKRRNIAIFLWRQPFQPCFAGMNPKRISACFKNLICNCIQCHFRVLIINAYPAFDCDGHRDNFLHGGDATCNHFRCLHQTSAECAGLNTVRRAADIEIDFIVAEASANSCSFL